jgi:rare lipoprotein A (peptidoglycan hydrolase)
VLGAVALGADVDDRQTVFREEDDASVYSDKFQGRRTANGERFDQDKPTVAHPELPTGAEVTVTNPDTGKKARLKVNAAGPMPRAATSTCPKRRRLPGEP